MFAYALASNLCSEAINMVCLSYGGLCFGWEDAAIEKVTVGLLKKVYRKVVLTIDCNPELPHLLCHKKGIAEVRKGLKTTRR